jgi:hypothetical protein
MFVGFISQGYRHAKIHIFGDFFATRDMQWENRDTFIKYVAKTVRTAPLAAVRRVCSSGKTSSAVQERSVWLKGLPGAVTEAQIRCVVPPRGVHVQ